MTEDVEVYAYERLTNPTKVLAYAVGYALLKYRGTNPVLPLEEDIMPENKGKPPTRLVQVNQPGGTRRPSPQPTDLAGIRRLRDILNHLPESASRQLLFQEGDVLAQEGATLAEDAPALLIVEGAVEEQMTYFVPGQGYVVQTVHLAQEGQFANVQTLVPAYKNQPAFCSIVASRDGYALMIYPSGLRQLENLGLLLHGEFRKYLKMLENLRQQNMLFGGLATKLEELRRRNPLMPGDPMQFVMATNNAFKRIEQLEGELRESRTRAKSEQDQNLQDELYETKFILDATNQQLVRSHKHVDELNVRNRASVDELNALRRDNGSLQEQVTLLRQEVISLTRSICDRELDLAGDFSKRFPHTLKVLETVAFRELTEQSEIARQATSSAEYRLNLMHRGLETLCQDHPELTVSKPVMHMFMGEEPPDQPAISRRKPTVTATNMDEIDAVFEEMELEPPCAQLLRIAPAKNAPRPVAAQTSPRATIAHMELPPVNSEAIPPPLPQTDEFSDEEYPSTPTMIPSAPVPPPFQQNLPLTASNDHDGIDWEEDDDGE